MVFAGVRRRDFILRPGFIRPGRLGLACVCVVGSTPRANLKRRHEHQLARVSAISRITLNGRRHRAAANAAFIGAILFVVSALLYIDAYAIDQNARDNAPGGMAATRRSTLPTCRRIGRAVVTRSCHLCSPRQRAQSRGSR